MGTFEREDAEVLAYNIVNQLADLWGVDTDLRQVTNDRSDTFVTRLIEHLLPPSDEATMTLPVGHIVSVVIAESRWSTASERIEVTVRRSKCRLCDERFIHYGNDPADFIAEIVCRQHVIRMHGGTLNVPTRTAPHIPVLDSDRGAVPADPVADTRRGTDSE